MGLLDFLFGADEEPRKRVFISFAIEDRKYRKYLVDQARLERSPFDFIDMSVKKAWQQNEWKKRCRTKIKGCHGMIALISTNTWYSSGARWEMRCAREEDIPVVGMHIQKIGRGKIPPELGRTTAMNWTWVNIEKFLNKI